MSTTWPGRDPTPPGPAWWRRALDDDRFVYVAPAGVLAALVGVLGEWSADAVTTYSGLEGPFNGWRVIAFSLLALVGVRPLMRRSAPGIALVLVCGVVMLTTAAHDANAAGFDPGWGIWLAVLGAILLILTVLRAVFIRAERGEGFALRFTWRRAFAGLGVALAVIAFATVRHVLTIEERASWPPGPDAITAAGAEVAIEEFAAGDPQARDVDLPYAWSTVDTIQPWVEGRNYFPRIFADVEAAESSVHVLMFGWTPGNIGDRMADLLIERLAAGVEVRVIVDGWGTKPASEGKEVYARLAAAGAQIVVNDTLPVDRDGLYPGRAIDWTPEEFGRSDHRKLIVVDGEHMWIGGSGIEDHFENGEFHDIMVRVTGDIVRQAQAAFLATFRAHDGPPPDDLAPLFPEPAVSGSAPAALLQTVPGGWVSAAQSIRETIENAERRLDIMNPYLTDKGMVERVIDAAERGVKVRIVVSEESNNPLATEGLRHRYPDLFAAGAEVYEYPDAVVHAKVIIADDWVHFGSVNLDAWALYRNFEIAVLAESPEAARLFRERLFEPDIARSKPGEPASGAKSRIITWFGDKIAYFL